MDKFVIPFKLPGLNDYVNINRGNKYKAAQMKKNIENDIKMCLIGLPKYDVPIKLHFTWIEGKKNRDCDNAAFAKKFILDAMKKAGKIIDDNNKRVVGFTDSFIYSDEFKVLIEIEEVDNHD